MSTELNYIKDVLVRLLHTPSPSGHTDKAIQLIEEEASKLGFESKRSRKGGLLITVEGRDSQSQRLITGHVDTLGAMVKEVLPSGRLRLTQVGGYAWNTIEGEYCTVHTQDGVPITGTIILHNTSIHVSREVGSTERKADNIEVVLDARVSCAEDVHKLGVSVGDFVSFDPRVELTDTGFIKSRHLDDKASVAILMGVLKTIKEQRLELPHTVNVLISNNEEIGYGGNSNVPSSVAEYLAVDMGAIGDGQTTDEYCVSICAKDSSGPYHLGLRRHLVHLAKQQNLKFAVDIYPFYGSDASAAMRAGYDVMHGLIGPGVANSHAYERMHTEAIENTYHLLIAYLQSALVSHS